MISNINDVKKYADEINDFIVSVSGTLKGKILDIEESNETKASIMREIESLRKELLEMKSEKSLIKNALKDDFDNLSRLTNINKAKQQELDDLLLEARNKEKTLDLQAADLKNKFNDIVNKKKEIESIGVNNDRILTDAKKCFEESVKMKSEALDITNSQSSRDHELTVKLESIKSKLKDIESKNVDLNKREEDIDKRLKEISVAEQLIFNKNKSIDSKLDEIRSRENILYTREKELDDAIKDKGLSKVIDDKKIIDEKNKNSEKQIKDKEARLDAYKKELELRAKDLENSERELNNKISDVNNKSVKLDDSMNKIKEELVKLELSKGDISFKLNSIIKRESAQKNREMRLLKLARDKGILINLKDLESK